MDDAYNGIILILELVRVHHPTLGELDKLVAEEKGARGLSVQYHSGKEDILSFCQCQLKIVKLVNRQFELTGRGQHLHRFLYSEAFPEELFHVLVSMSAERFLYFNHVYIGLTRHVQKGRTTIARAELEALLDETNKVSRKEIKHLMVACGAVEIQDDKVRLSPHLLGIDPTEVQIRHLLNSLEDVMKEHGRLVYAEAIGHLERLHPDINIKAVESRLRSHLVLNASRTVEYIDAIR